MQPFDKEYVCGIAKQILNIDSPTGHTKEPLISWMKKPRN